MDYCSFATRAVHIKVTGDLSTDVFLLALRRFISKQGNVKVMRTDNGTNFVGANNELRGCIAWIFKSPAGP